MDLQQFLKEWYDNSPTLLVHTSGATGAPKPMWVEKRRMEASARITCQFLGLRQGDTALLCMPLDYIAGKMMVVRALTCGLRLVSVKPEGLPHWEGDISFAAMVPGKARLQRVEHLIIGGGAIDDALQKALQDFPNHVWSTYGMTETLSHIALRRLNGPDRSDWYTPFEGVTVGLNGEGCLTIDAPTVHDGPLQTNDIAELDGQHFRIVGRKDNVVCSGGIKIQIEEVERRLRAHVHVPYMITKAPDEKFGEQVVMLTESEDTNGLLSLCHEVLPKYWQPRTCLTVGRLPLTATGKPARKEAERMAQRATTRKE